MFTVTTVSANQFAPSFGYETERVPIMHGLLVREEPIDLGLLSPPAPVAPPAKKARARKSCTK